MFLSLVSNGRQDIILRPTELSKEQILQAQQALQAQRALQEQQKLELEQLKQSMETGETKEYIIKLITCGCYDVEDQYGTITLTDPQYELLGRYLPDHPCGSDAKAQYVRSLLDKLNYDPVPGDKCENMPVLEYECGGCYAPLR